MRPADIGPFRRTPAICVFLVVGMLPSTPGLSQTFESGSHHVSQKNPFQSLIEKIVENTHPSVLGAHGTGQLLAREMPVIMQRLRDTRSAIEALGDEDFRGRSASPQEQPFAFVKDPSDRKVLVRDLENLQYLLRELDVAIAAGDTALVEDFRAEIDRKNRDVDRILGSWGRELDEEEKLDLSGDWTCTRKCPAGGEGKTAHIAQNGDALRFTNEGGDTSEGRFEGRSTVVALGWGDLKGTVRDQGNSIHWANGTIWARP